MNTVATNRIAAAIRAARKAGTDLGLTFGTARWANCKSVKDAYGAGGVQMIAYLDGGWSIRDRAGSLIASGRA